MECAKRHDFAQPDFALTLRKLRNSLVRLFA